MTELDLPLIPKSGDLRKSKFECLDKPLLLPPSDKESQLFLSSPLVLWSLSDKQSRVSSAKHELMKRNYCFGELKVVEDNKQILCTAQYIGVLPL